MKDYFAALISKEVTSVTKGNNFLKPNEIAIVEDQGLVTSQNHLRSNKGNTIDHLFHPVTPPQNQKVTTKVKTKGALHQQHVITLQNEELSYFYNERAAILEFEGGLDRPKSERIAQQDALSIFLKETYPAILGQFESIVKHSLLN